jgi:hypothetical protein
MEEKRVSHEYTRKYTNHKKKRFKSLIRVIRVNSWLFF